MQLHTLMKLIKNNFMVDEKLKVYIYEDRIDFIDYTSPIDLPDGELLKEFNGLLISLYTKENKIVAIEHHSLNLITPKNKNIYTFLCSLIETSITDLHKFPIITKDCTNEDDLVQIL